MALLNKKNNLFWALLLLSVLFLFNSCDLLFTNYTLTIEIVGSGSVQPTEGDHVYRENTVVDLIATPDQDNVFSHWEGAVLETHDSETTILMDQDQVVIANFVPKTEPTITIKKVTAENGLIQVELSDDLSITPTELCFTARYQKEPVVKEHFAIFEREINTIWPQPYSLKMSLEKAILYSAAFADLPLTDLDWSPEQAANVTLYFDPFEPENIDISYLIKVNYQDGEFVEAEDSFKVPASEPSTATLTIIVDGKGKTSPDEGTHEVDISTQVDLKAFADEGAIFKKWIGDVDNPQATETFIQMDQDKTITCVFENYVYPLAPGEIITTIDGIQIASKEGAFTDEITLFFTREDDPTPSLPLPSYYQHGKIVSDFYGIAGEKNIDFDYCLLLGFPLPEGLNPATLSFLVLWPTPVSSFPPQEEATENWLRFTPSYDEETDMLILCVPFLTFEPFVIVLVDELFNPSTAQTSEVSMFNIICIGLDEDDCENAAIVTERALNEAWFEFFYHLGIRNFMLERERDCTFFFWCRDGRYEYELRQPGPNSPRGSYTIIRNGQGEVISGRAATFVRPHFSDELLAEIAVHELFHAAQHAFSEYANCDEKVWDLLEGTANLAAGALRPAERRASIAPLSINYSLLSEDQTHISYADSSWAKYQTQDFWAFLGLEMEAFISIGDSFLVELFRSGGNREEIKTWVENDFAFPDLSTAYWEWIKNHSFEKQVIIGENSLGENVPLGDPNEWSGHGFIDFLDFDPVNSTVAGDDDTFTLEPLSGRVYDIYLPPTTNSYGITLEVASPDPFVQFKYYAQHLDPIDATRDNTPYQSIIGTESENIFLLVANTNPDASSSDIDLVFDQFILFEDKTLEKIIRDALNKPVGNLYLRELLNITELSCCGQNLPPDYDPIKSLAGLEYLRNLTNLSLTHHEITNLDALRNLRHLEKLDLKHNAIVDFQLSNLPHLEYLSLQDNYLEKLVIFDLESLVFLDLKALDNNDHDIHFLKIYNLPRLTFLDLSNCQINISSFQRFENMPQLNELILINNELTALDFLQDLTALEYLYLHSNAIEDISPLERLLNLTYLGLNYNTHDTLFWNNVPTLQCLNPLVKNAEAMGLGLGDRVDLYGSIYFFNHHQLEADIDLLINRYEVEVFWSTTIGQNNFEPLIPDYIHDRTIERIRKNFDLPWELNLPFNYYPPLFDVPGFEPYFFTDIVLELGEETIYLHAGDFIILHPYTHEDTKLISAGQFILRRSDHSPINQMQILSFDCFKLADQKQLESNLLIPVEKILFDEDYLKIEPGEIYRIKLE